MYSNVGSRHIHEAQEQRPPKTTGPEKGTIEQRERFEYGPGPAHINTDPKDQRTLENRLNAEIKRERKISESRETVKDPLKPAMDHGNKPSRGAMIDAELQRDDEQRLREKGKID